MIQLVRFRSLFQLGDRSFLRHGSSVFLPNFFLFFFLRKEFNNFYIIDILHLIFVTYKCDKNVNFGKYNISSHCENILIFIIIYNYFSYSKFECSLN